MNIPAEILYLRNQIARDTADRAVRGVRSSGPEAARRSALRAEEEWASRVLRGTPPPACRPGCAFCCYLHVVVGASEVFGLLRYLKNRLTEAEFIAFSDRCNETAAHIHAITHQQHLLSNVRCPVLTDEGTCGAYAARPLRCRTHHSMNVAPCEASFHNPAIEENNIPLDIYRRTLGDAVTNGLEVALAQTGYDARLYELTTALSEAITDADAERRYLERREAFLIARVVAAGPGNG